MSSPEASIEEILASIRKTFTDEPELHGSKPVATAVESRPSGLPPFRSATETAAADGTTSLPTPPRSRVAAIDDDLDDLIDKPANKPSAASFIPQPSVPPPAATMSPVDAAREKWANLLNPHGTSNGSAAKAAEAKSEVAMQPVPSAPAPAPAPSSGLFAPRKGGFYPPQDSRPEPTLPMPSAAPPPPAAAPIEKATPSAAPVTKIAPAAAPQRPGFIPFPQPAQQAVPAAEPAPATAAQASSATAASAVSAPVPEVPAASARALDDLVAELNNVAHVPAEVAAPAPAMQPEPLAPAPTAAANPEPVSIAATVSSPVAATVATEAAAPASASRSFEDVVADMLRPLLEKWIDENMPRIVERALQRDAALGRKPGQ